MYPSQLHMIRYNNKYLGKNNNVFAFIKPTTASFVVSKLKCENFTIANIDPCTYVIQQRPKIAKPLNKRVLDIKSFDPRIGTYFSSINNMKIILIDDATENSNNITLKSYFSISDNFPPSEENIKEHMCKAFKTYPQEIINYEQEFCNMVINDYVDTEIEILTDEDDE